MLQVTQQFRIRLIQVDDSLPVITMNKMMTTEGQNKPISEFDIKVTDNDTKVSELSLTWTARCVVIEYLTLTARWVGGCGVSDIDCNMGGCSN